MTVFIFPIDSPELRGRYVIRRKKEETYWMLPYVTEIIFYNAGATLVFENNGRTTIPITNIKQIEE